MIRRRLKRNGVALITPFNDDGSVDYQSLMRLVEYQIQNGVDFLCVLGTTAETPTLSAEEKKKIKQLVVERVNGRVPILLGVGANSTQTVIDTLQNDDMTGVDAVLVVVPYYNKPSQEGIYQHYKAIANSTKLPIVLYNVPGRTGGEHDGRNHAAPGARFRQYRRYQGSLGKHHADGRHHQAQAREL